MLITFRDKGWSAGQQVSCTLSEDNYYNVGSNTSQTGPWSDVSMSDPSCNPIPCYSNVCGGGASLSLITGLARLILEGSDRCELMLQQCLTDRRQIDRKYSD